MSLEGTASVTDTASPSLTWARGFHFLTFAVAAGAGAGAVILQLVLVFQGYQHLGDSEPSVETIGHPGLGTQLVRFCSYLTIWFNVLVAGTSLLLAVDPQSGGPVFERAGWTPSWSRSEATPCTSSCCAR